MVSTLNLDEKYNRVRRNFCFYLDIQDHGLARSISRRIQDIGLQEEVFLTSRVSHVVRERAAAAGAGAALPAPCARREGRRADAMLERVRRDPPPHVAHPPASHTYVTLSVQKAINLLDKLYDTFFTASRKSHVRLFTRHFIKIEFLDKWCRPIYKEFDEWPSIGPELDPPRDRRENKPDLPPATIPRHATAERKMTRKSRPRAKEGGGGGGGGGYCEMCNCSYSEAGAHRRSAPHLAFVRDRTNYLALDSLISSGADVSALLDAPAERRSQRHYYKVVGVSTKLRSGGGCARPAHEPPVNGRAEPLVVKFRKVRRSELSVLSDEAEQFMFPKRASSSSSSSSDDDKVLSAKRRSPVERRRLARPLALKEESSEEDGWPEDARRRKRRAAPAGKRARRPPGKAVALELPAEPAPAPAADSPAPAADSPAPAPAPASPLRAGAERCMRWEDGRLKYSPAVEQLEFAFESVPRSEPWYETFTRQDQDKVLARNVPRYFALYSNGSPKLPYEIGQLPPLKPNCCPLSDLVRAREERAGPSRAYGTRGMKQQKVRKRAAAGAAGGRPRKSPREHASTLAILGSAGLLHRRRPPDDSKSTASEETGSDTLGSLKPEPAPPDSQDASERLQRFLCDVFAEADELDECGEALPVAAARNPPDVSSLFSECDACDLLREQLRAAAPRARRHRGKKKNRTGWPSKKKQKKGSRANSSDSERRTEEEGPAGGSSSAERDERDEDTRDALSELDTNASEPEAEGARGGEEAAGDADSSDKLLIDLKVVVDEEKGARSASSSEERELRKKRRALQGLCDWLPVVRVARVQPAVARRLRSAARAPPARTR